MLPHNRGISLTVPTGLHQKYSLIEAHLYEGQDRTFRGRNERHALQAIVMLDFVNVAWYLLCFCVMPDIINIYNKFEILLCLQTIYKSESKCVQFRSVSFTPPFCLEGPPSRSGRT